MDGIFLAACQARWEQSDEGYSESGWIYTLAEDRERYEDWETRWYAAGMVTEGYDDSDDEDDEEEWYTEEMFLWDTASQELLTILDCYWDDDAWLGVVRGWLSDFQNWPEADQEDWDSDIANVF